MARQNLLTIRHPATGALSQTWRSMISPGKDIGHLDDQLRGIWVVIVHWGDPALTQAAVKAVKTSTRVPSERILVVDNGAASGIPAAEARVLPLPENRGYAAGVNAGLQEALRSGAHAILVLNNDLLLPPGAVEAMITALRAPQERLGCVGAVLDEGDATPVYGGGRVTWWRGRAHLVHRPEETATLDYISGACFLVAKACVEEVGGLPERYFLYWEDVAYGFAMRKQGWGLAVASTPIVSHPRSHGTADSKVKAYYLVRNGALFAREYAPRAIRMWLLELERPRLRWATLKGKWEVVRALQDARAGVTGPLPAGTNVNTPP